MVDKNKDRDILISQLKRRRAREANIEKVREAMEMLVDCVNSMQEDEVADGVAQGLMSRHPTLRQGFSRSFISAAKKITEEDRGVDLRSQGSKVFLRYISEFDGSLPFI